MMYCEEPQRGTTARLTWYIICFSEHLADEATYHSLSQILSWIKTWLPSWSHGLYFLHLWRKYRMMRIYTDREMCDVNCSQLMYVWRDFYSNHSSFYNLKKGEETYIESKFGLIMTYCNCALSIHCQLWVISSHYFMQESVHVIVR